MEHSIFWCKVNKFYLNKWLGYFRDRGTALENAHLMATCVVTDRAKSKRQKQAKKILKWGKDLYLTWCWAFEKGEAMDYEKFYELYPTLSPWRESITLLWEDPAMQSDLWAVWTYELNTDTPDEQPKALYTKKFIVIQSWCDTFCTFCLTIYKRWSNRNRPAEDIIQEINEFVAHWWKEIVITWVNLAAWWASHTRKWKESSFTWLLTMIINRTAIERIRISSLWPEFLDDEFFTLMENKRFLPHFHFSIQHFNDAVLKRMNRNYGAARLDDVLTRIRALKRDDRDLISIWADLIVWFPGETDDDFQQMLDAVRDHRITKLHAFPFSPHERGETVPAWSFSDQLSMTVKRERMNRLLEVWEAVRNEFLEKNKWHTWNVLVEEQKKGITSWWTDNYIHVQWIEWSSRGDIIQRTL